MKNKGKLLGLAVVIAAIVFCFTACSADGGSGGGPPPGGLPDVIYLRAQNGDINSTSGVQVESWNSNRQIKFSDFTNVKPKKDDLLKFKISGVSDNEIKFCRIQIFQMKGDDWNTYKWLGTSWHSNGEGKNFVALPCDINNYIYVDIYEETNPDFVFYVELMNFLWYKQDASIVSDSGERLPENTKDGTIMATIRNFKISLSVENK